jgi:hypothetical protein
MTTTLDENTSSITVGSGDNQVAIRLKELKPVSYLREETTNIYRV